MNVLHLLSNWKWTERSEPASELALAEQRQGVQVTLACGRAPGTRDDVAAQARAKGVESVVALDLPKHIRPLRLWRDAGRLRRFIAELDPDVVHAHMPNAHLLAALAGAGGRRGRLLIRTCYDPSGPSRDWRSRLLLRRHTDGLVVLDEGSKDRATTDFGLPDDAVAVSEPGIDLERFSPDREVQDLRSELGLAPDAGSWLWDVAMAMRWRPW